MEWYCPKLLKWCQGWRKRAQAKVICTTERQASISVLKARRAAVEHLLLSAPEELAYGTTWLPKADVGCDGDRALCLVTPWLTGLVFSVAVQAHKDPTHGSLQSLHAGALRGVSSPIAFNAGMADREVYSFHIPEAGWPEQSWLCLWLHDGTKLQYVLDNPRVALGPLPLFRVVKVV